MCYVFVLFLFQIGFYLFFFCLLNKIESILESPSIICEKLSQIVCEKTLRGYNLLCLPLWYIYSPLRECVHSYNL